MKKILIEEKAKRYDEALEKAKLVLQERGNEPDGASILSELFPELKESDDKRIIKRIIQALHGDVLDMEETNKAIAWLEKKNSNIDNANKEYWRGYREGKQEILDKYAELKKQGNLMKALQISNARIGELIEKNYYLKEQLEKQVENNMGISEATKQKLEDNLNKALEKETPESWNKFLDEQKPTDKAKPKFKVGDFVRSKYSKAVVLKIEEVCNDIYKTERGGYIRIEFQDDWELIKQKPAEEYNITSIDSKNAQGKLGEMIKNLNPVNEVLEQNPTGKAEFKIGDVVRLKYGDGLEWLVKEKHEDGNYTIACADRDDFVLLDDNWELVEQKSYWSEEDEKCIKLSTDIIDSALRAGFCVQLDRDRCVDWLKSLKERYIWKPSEEQMKGIECAIKTLQYQLNVGDKRLNSLYDDLKKLKG